jgi:hypothetical protein
VTSPKGAGKLKFFREISFNNPIIGIIGRQYIFFFFACGNLTPLVVFKKALPEGLEGSKLPHSVRI